MASKTKSVDMCNGPLTKKIILFTVPLIFSGILQLLFNAADLVVIGRFAGDISLAAVGSTSSLTNLMINLFMGFSISVGITITHAIGAKKKRDVFEIVHTAIPLSLISGVFVGIVGFIFVPFFLGLMGTPQNVLEKASLYLRIIFIGMPANMLYNFGASMLRATGETKKTALLSFIFRAFKCGFKPYFCDFIRNGRSRSCFGYNSFTIPFSLSYHKKSYDGKRIL